MQQIEIKSPGGYEKLEIISKADPIPADDEYRVKVAAAGVNYADVIVREGYYTAAKGKYPIVPGFEFSGVVDKAGSNATGFDLGDRVFGYTVFGAYSSMIVVKSHQLRRMPDHWSFAHCATLPAAHLTAYHALHNVADCQSGNSVLIHSAAGGVGLALVQQAKMLGCKTVAIVGASHKAELVKNFGASVVISKSRELWQDVDAAEREGFDAVFDANGVTTPRPGFNRLKPGGRLVVYGFAEVFPRGKRPFFPFLALNVLRIPRFSPFEMTSSNRAVMGLNLAFLSDHRELADKAFTEIATWAASGLISPVPNIEFPASQVAAAHKTLESGASSGKLVLTF